MKRLRTAVNIVAALVLIAALAAVAFAHDQGAQDVNRGVKLTNSANQSIPNGVWTALAFDTEIWDWDWYNWHDNAVNNSRIVPTADRRVINLTCAVEFATNSTGSRAVAIRQNGSLYLAVSGGGSGSQERPMVSVSVEIPIGSSPYFECVAYQNSGGSLNVILASQWSPIFTAITEMWTLPKPTP